LISLGTFLRPHGCDEDASYVRALSLLLQGIELHTLEHNPEDYECFQAELSGVQRGLFPKISIPWMFVLVGRAIKALEEYSRRTAGRLRAQFTELQSITSTLSNAITSMVSASEASLARLRAIQTLLSAAERMDDLRLVKKHLCDCLNDMAADVQEHRHNSVDGGARLAEGAQELENSIHRAQRRVASDPVTGLPARAEAEAALSQIAATGDAAVAVVLTLKRLKQMNSRFGHGVGDSLLAKLSTYLQSGASLGAGPYRWSGPALMAIITRNVSFDRIRHEIGGLVADMPEYQIAVGERMVTILASVGWAVLPVTGAVDKLVRELDEFVVSQNLEDC
jgi:diguanylate cyclase (GGDEF)-like protein